MKEYWVLAGIGPQVQRVRTRKAKAADHTTISPVLTVRDVCRRLRKSRRQVYRYLREGRLQPCAQVLGQWLFAGTEVERLARYRIPRTLQRFFWDVRLASLSVDHHRDFILGRLLESGNRQALRWVFQVYSREQLAVFLQGRGQDTLSARAWHFWAGYLGLPVAARRQTSWRARGRIWGGGL